MSDGDYKSDRMFGEKLMPGVKAILGQFLLSGELETEDTQHNTDLITLQMQTQRIGVRIRRFNAYERWPDEFTIRYDRPTSGATTELVKIMQGWGDYFFYGFSNMNETAVIHWFIGDFKIFRIYILNQAAVDWNGFLRTHLQQNKDEGGSRFVAIPRHEIKGFVVASAETWQGVTPENWQYQQAPNILQDNYFV